MDSYGMICFLSGVITQSIVKKSMHTSISFFYLAIYLTACLSNYAAFSLLHALYCDDVQRISSAPNDAPSNLNYYYVT